MKIRQANSIKIKLSKPGFKEANYSLDPKTDIPKDGNKVYYLSPLPKDSGEPSSITPQSQNILKGNEKTSPIQFLKDYFEHINNNDIEQAWEMLTPQAQETLGPSFSKFEEWYTVNKVSIQNILLVDESKEKAHVKVQLKYIRGDKVIPEKLLEYHLIWNNSKDDWQISGRAI